MKPSLQKLQKFFKLEAERGYDNHAVMGGLDRMLGIWEAEARVDQIPEELIQAVIERVRDYSRLSPASRAETLEGLWRRIQRSEGLPESQLAPPSYQPSPDLESLALAEKPVVSIEENHEQALAAVELDTAGDAVTERVGKPVQPTKLTPAREARDTEPVALNASVTVLPGVGPRYAQTLARLGLRTLRDMLYYFPRRYDDYTQLKPINRLWYGEEVTVIGSVDSINLRPLRSGQMQIVEAVVSDGTGALRVAWFNQPWIAKRLGSGAQIVLSGKIDQYLGRLVMNNPEWEPLEQQQLSTNRIVPVYPLTAQVTQRWLRRLMNQVVTYWAPRVQDPLPDELLRSAGLVKLSTALLQAHFPDSLDDLRAARQRLAFDEIFLLQLGVLRQKQGWQNRAACVFEVEESWLEDQIERLPFALTQAQQHALDDVRHDLAYGRPMNRLLQGDVGSGKTVIAALGIAIVTNHGSQAAVMAPTSILAEQHYHNMLSLLAGGIDQAEKQPQPDELPVEPVDQQPDIQPVALVDQGSDEKLNPPLLRRDEVCLMIGATPEAEKRQIRDRLADGSIKLVIGTHALIEEPVIFSDLQMVVVDEQHRFGVEQRAALRAKGATPHLMVMTATPIPRSLALTVYGDLDLSVMDEMPPGRQPVSTYVLLPRERERAYSLIRSQLEQGRQAFIIYPLVEESDRIDAKAAVEEYSHLQTEHFPKYKLGLLHGRMRSDEKDGVMTQFRDGEYQLLVSTSVVEVGIDVPNATVMLIEGANRFGLSQLHQFRGRVGRSAEKSYCLLIPDTPDEAENERLQVMCETNDGFILAERDLEQRGPGQFLGTRQSGFSELKLANLTDVHLIEQARRHAQALFEQDSELNRPEHKSLAQAFDRFWSGTRADIS
jgi:ATP-dependent DNA helicase RecG